MTKEEIEEIIKLANASRPQVNQTMNFNAPIGQQIAHVDKIEAHFDKDMGMQVTNASEMVTTAGIDKTEVWLRENNIVLSVDRNKRLYTFQLLYEFINKNFVNCFTHTYEWYALYRFLKDEGYCNGKCDVSKFAEQMNTWFSEISKKCSVSETNRYSVLNGYDVNEWSGLDEKKLGSRSKTNKKGIGNIHQIYTSLKEKHDVL